jgi:hypothetical protein
MSKKKQCPVRLEATSWDYRHACSEFHFDFGWIPEDLRNPSALGIGMSPLVECLYTDLLEADAENRLKDLLVDIRCFMEDPAGFTKYWEELIREEARLKKLKKIMEVQNESQG